MISGGSWLVIAEGDAAQGHLALQPARASVRYLRRAGTSGRACRRCTSRMLARPPLHLLERVPMLRIWPIGSAKAAARARKATRSPTEILPAITCMPPTPSKAAMPKPGQQRRHHARCRAGAVEVAAGRHGLGVEAGPAAEGILLSPPALMVSIERTMPTVAPISALRVLHQPLRGGRRGNARPGAARDDVDEGDRQHDQSEGQVDRQHHDQEQDRGGEAEHRGREAAGEQACHVVIGGKAVGEIAGMALGEEHDRQAQQMPDEAARHGEGELAFELQQIVALQPEHGGAEQGGRRHARAAEAPASRSSRRSGCHRRRPWRRPASPRRARSAAGSSAARAARRCRSPAAAPRARRSAPAARRRG